MNQINDVKCLEDNKCCELIDCRICHDNMMIECELIDCKFCRPKPKDMNEAISMMVYSMDVDELIEKVSIINMEL